MGLEVITFSSIDCPSGLNANLNIDSSYKSFLKYADYTKLSFLIGRPFASCSTIIILVKHFAVLIYNIFTYITHRCMDYVYPIN